MWWSKLDTLYWYLFNSNWIYILDDERAQTFDRSPNVEEKTVELAKKIISKLKFSYKPSNFKNPKLQQFWAHLEALALEYDAPETVVDDTGKIYNHF